MNPTRNTYTPPQQQPSTEAEAVGAATVTETATDPATKRPADPTASTEPETPATDQPETPPETAPEQPETPNDPPAEPVQPPEPATAAKATETPPVAGQHSGLIIPDIAVQFIRYQRSRYIERKVPDPEEVKQRYAAHVLEDFENMKPHLPPADQVKTILEIGCGVGALNVHLQRHYPNARVELLDGDTVSNAGGAGYSDKPDIYNSRAITEAFLKANGCKVDKWHDIGTREVLKADLIVSLASCGFHYPVSTYAYKSKAIIMDLRRGVEPVRGRIIFNGPKYERCLFSV